MLTENKFLFKNLLHGLKTFFYQLRNSNPEKLKQEVDGSYAPGGNDQWPEFSCGFSAEEVEVLIKLFREGGKCFQYYAPLDQQPEGTTAEAASSQSLASSRAIKYRPPESRPCGRGGDHPKLPGCRLHRSSS